MALFDTIRAGASGASEFEIERSLRFDEGTEQHIAMTYSSASNRRTMTLSLWIKRANFDTQSIFDAFQNDSNRTRIFFTDQHNIQFFSRVNNSDNSIITTGKFRDPTSWMHLVVAIDTTQSTASNRVKIYINGVQQETNSDYPGQNTDLFFSNSVIHRFGLAGDDQGNEDAYDGYMAEINYIDGQQLTPSSFAETDTITGQWNPIDTAGLTFGTNGFRLQFLDNSGTSDTTLGKDTSGNSHNFNPFTFGTGDAVKDTPSNNFCTLNSVNDAGKAFGNGTLSESGLRYTGGSSNRSIGSTFGIRHTDTQGYYFEARIISGNQANRLFVGIGYTSTNWISTDARGANDDSWVLRNGDGVFIHNSSVDGETTGAGALSVGDVIQIAVKGSKIWVGKNGSYFFSGNPSGDSTPKFSDIASTWTPVADVMTSNVVQFNFGQDSSFSNTITAQGNTDANGHGDFSYAPPTGFLALCSKNLPEPTILQGDQYFDIATWAGNDGSQTISSLGFQPDLVWIKATDRAENHFWTDSVRGAGKSLPSNVSAAETDNSSKFTGFTSSGFTMNTTDNEINGGGVNYVSWNWAAGTSFSNSAGSNSATIASSGSVNTTAGFSIVSYVGNATRDQLVYHGLNAAPKWFIVKRRDGDNWIMYHGESFDSNPQRYYYEFQNQDAVKGANDAFMWDDIVPDSNNFGIYSDGAVNNNGSNIIAWVWSEVAGFSKFGHFIGNGNAEGAYVHCGFTPRFVMVKNNNQGFNTVIQDTKRSPNNVAAKKLCPDSTAAEASGNDKYDILSNGFKMRTSDAGTNASGSRYVFMAFASNPFKYARAR